MDRQLEVLAEARRIAHERGSRTITRADVRTAERLIGVQLEVR